MFVFFVFYFQIHLILTDDIYKGTGPEKTNLYYANESQNKYPLLINLGSDDGLRKNTPKMKLMKDHNIYFDINEAFVKKVKDSLNHGTTDAVKNKYNVSKEKEIKAKLYKMTVEERRRAQQKVELINRLLDLYKHKLSLKLDFIAHYFNVNFMKLSQRFDEAKNNINGKSVWDVLSLYTELFTSNQFLSEFLTLLPSAMNLDPPEERDGGTPEKRDSISWSYYDDSMSLGIGS